MYVQCLNFNIMNRVFDVAYGKKNITVLIRISIHLI